MPKKLPKILAINPGTRYVGIAVLEGPDLKDWQIKVIKGKWSKDKIQKIKEILLDFIDQYEPKALAIKKIHRSRTSKNLNQLVSRIKQFSKRKGLKIFQYPIKDLEAFFITEGKKNKRNLAEMIASRYPDLLPEFHKEKNNKNSYHIRAFEAVALGAACSHQLDKN